MKVGTDGVLLGAFADISSAKLVLDIGTGTGLIALMLAQRCSAIINAIEIDKDAYEEAVLNIANSPWPNRIRLFQISLQEYYRQTHEKYDLIVCNPPFFKDSLLSAINQRNLARHDSSLPPENLFEGISGLLNPTGVCQIIIPAESLNYYTQVAEDFKLYIQYILIIKPTPYKEPKRVIVTFGKQPMEVHKLEMVIESGGRHVYSSEYRELTKDFYLSF